MAKTLPRLKAAAMLMSPDWTTGLPNWAYVDHENKAHDPETDFHHPQPTGSKAPGVEQDGVFSMTTARTPAEQRAAPSSPSCSIWTQPIRALFLPRSHRISSVHRFLSRCCWKPSWTNLKLSQPVRGDFAEDRGAAV